MKSLFVQLSIFFLIFVLSKDCTLRDIPGNRPEKGKSSLHKNKLIQTYNPQKSVNTINYLFPKEIKFKIISTVDSAFFLKPGDLFSISTEKGLKHFRDNTLQNNYKTIPEVVVVNHFGNYEIVYYLWTIKKFISVRDNCFLISSENFEESFDATQPILIHWESACELEAVVQ